MAEIIKFNERNIALFAAGETVPGTYVAPVASNAIAATALNGAVTYETGSFRFLGDNLSRDEYTYTKDTYADVSIDTFQQVLGALDTTSSGSTILANYPLTNYMKAVGGSMTAITTTAWNSHPVGSVLIDNVNAADTTVSIDYRKTSIQDTTNQKLWKFINIRGTVDITANLGEVPALKFTYKGNATNPIASPILSPNFGAQASRVAASIRKQNVVSASIIPVVQANSITFVGTTATVTALGHGLSTGDSVEITGVKISGSDSTLYNGTFVVTVVDINTFTYTMSGTPAANATGSPIVIKNGVTKTFNFSTLNAPNFFGFDLTRYLTSTEEGFSKDAVPTDVTIGMVEDQSPAHTATAITFVTTTATATITNHGMYPRVSIAATAGTSGQPTLTFTSTTGFTLNAPFSGIGVPPNSYIGALTATQVTIYSYATLAPVNLTAAFSGSYTAGNTITVSGATDPLYNGTFNVATAPDANTITYTMTGTPVANAVADVIGTLRVVNNQAVGFDPDSNLSNFYAVKLKFGTGAGSYVTYMWNKLQLANVKPGKVANLLSRECTFRNTGKSFIYLE